MIRAATLEDIRRIVEMSERFYPHTSYYKDSQMEFSPEACGALAIAMIEGGCMQVAELDGKVVGMIGLMFIPFMFNPKYMVGAEVIWWVEPECWGSGVGQNLLETAEAIAKIHGLKHIQMVDLPNSTLSAARLYERNGYMLTERCYTKRIN